MGVCFDIGGTLVSMPRGAIADEIATVLPISRKRGRCLLEEYGERERCDISDLARTVASASGYASAAPLILSILRRRALELEAASPRPEATRTLRKLRQRGWKIFFLSNAIGFAGVGAPNWYRLADKAVHSFEIGYVKPERGAFRAIERASGLTPDQLIHVGNSWDRDVTGALAAGWGVVYQSTRHPPASHSEVRRAHTFNELLRVLGKPAQE